MEIYADPFSLIDLRPLLAAHKTAREVTVGNSWREGWVDYPQHYPSVCVRSTRRAVEQLIQSARPSAHVRFARGWGNRFSVSASPAGLDA